METQTETKVLTFTKKTTVEELMESIKALATRNYEAGYAQGRQDEREGK